MSELAGAVAKRNSDRLAWAMDAVMVHRVKIVDFMVVNEIGLIISVCGCKFPAGERPELYGSF